MLNDLRPRPLSILNFKFIIRKHTLAAVTGKRDADRGGTWIPTALENRGVTERVHKAPDARANTVERAAEEGL